MIKRQICLESFLSSEDKITDGVYKPELNDPELCNPFASSLWELSLLEVSKTENYFIYLFILFTLYLTN